MLPLPDWNDWTPDRQYWTYPAVVRAFPRCLFEIDLTMPARRSRSPGTEQPERAAATVAAARGGDIRRQLAGGEEASDKGLTGTAPGVVVAVGQQQSQWQEQDQGGNNFNSAYADEAQTSEVPVDLVSIGSKRLALPLKPPPLPLAHMAQYTGTPGATEPKTQVVISPFEPYWMGEAWIRAADNSALSLAGVGAGPWRRRWLMLRQTYLFEFVHPPSPTAAAVTSLTGVQQDETAGGERVQADGGKQEEEVVLPLPTGFLSLSGAFVDEGSEWGRRTLLVR